MEGLRQKEIQVVLSTSCSLLHVPYTLENEEKLAKEYLDHFAFAKEKLTELQEIGKLAEVKKPIVRIRSFLPGKEIVIMMK